MGVAAHWGRELHGEGALFDAVDHLSGDEVGGMTHGIVHRPSCVHSHLQAHSATGCGPLEALPEGGAVAVHDQLGLVELAVPPILVEHALLQLRGGELVQGQARSVH